VRGGLRDGAQEEPWQDQRVQVLDRPEPGPVTTLTVTGQPQVAPGSARPVARPVSPRVAVRRWIVARCSAMSGAVVRRAGSFASERGMATAEYAIVTVAAVGFAGLLIVVLRSGEVQGLLLGIIRGALSV